MLSAFEITSAFPFPAHEGLPSFLMKGCENATWKSISLDNPPSSRLALHAGAAKPLCGPAERYTGYIRVIGGGWWVDGRACAYVQHSHNEGERGRKINCSPGFVEL